MKLTSILTLPACTPAEKARRIVDLAVAHLAHRLPKRLRYHVLISCGVQAIQDHEVVPHVSYVDVLQRTPQGWPNV